MKTDYHTNTFTTAKRSFLTTLAVLGTALSCGAKIPVELPSVDADAPVAKDKPVKIYIMSGQSNMLGFGRIEEGKPIYPLVYLSADPAARDADIPVGGAAMMKMKLSPAEDGQEPLALGSTAAEVPAGKVEAFLEVPLSGLFKVNIGHEDSSLAVATIDGQEVYRKSEGGDAVYTEIGLKKGKRYKLSINYEKGGSGALWLQKMDQKPMGHLRWVVEELGKYKSLLDENGEWVARPDVIHTDAYMGKGKSEPLSAPACGKTFGPELGFGWVMGEFHDEPVIVMKADIGNRSLGWDILPPGSETWEHEGRTYPGYGLRLDDDGNLVKPKEGQWYAGMQYDLYTASVQAVLDQFDEKFPQYKDQGYEIAGFVWWQGHKDGPSAGHNAAYERNMANLIKAWRKEFNAPEADWTIATVGFHGENMPEHYQKIAQAQLNVADPERHPDLAGTVKTIDARPFWRPMGMSPAGQDYHYNHNAETYLLVGDALGRAMVELKGGQAEYPSAEIDESVSYIPALDKLKPAELASMDSALKPIILNEIIPDYIERAPSVPIYLRKGAPMSELVNNTPIDGKSDKISYSLRSQYDVVASYYELAGVDAYSWKDIEGTDLEAEWDYYTFDPKEPGPTKKTLKRYREVTLPDGMDNWMASDFDAAKAGWKKGKAPFGQNNGEQKPLRANCSVNYCQCDMMPNTFWDKEVLLMRRTMKMPDFDPDHRYRLVVGGAGHVWSGEGFALYINGALVAEATEGYYKNGGYPRGTFLFEDFQEKYAGKEVEVAVKGFLRMSYHRNRKAPPTGHLNAWVQQAKLPATVLKAYQ